MSGRLLVRAKIATRIGIPVAAATLVSDTCLLRTARCEKRLPAGPHGDPVPTALVACIDAASGCREPAAAEVRESGVPAPDGPRSSDAWLAYVKSRLPPVR